MASIPRIEMRDIKKSFGKIQSLRGVNLELYPGEVLGLVGDNGAGKSTLMKVLSGVHIPDSGTMKFEGQPIQLNSPKDAKKHQIETIFQDLALCDTLDVASNLYLGREPVHFFNQLIDQKKMHEQAKTELDRLGVTIPSTYVTVENLSGGQRQSVAIARAVIYSPKVLIMDEPTAALGVKEVRMVLELIQRVKRTGVSVILITHRLRDLFEVCDRITVLYEGRIIDNRPISDFTMESLVASITAENEEVHS
ncbi:ATP-binding cassette domain-containing protein [Sporolactobacillus spathodeae]|uniref:Simple sugar transport system ATP-binding protein n=1 Tax=Sporolactobacillus spathodeae TaxID=1465502 RepID=A0ABS2Q7V7_9BACL|nr:ATP-binding cassette domain-containing protein [Sporolactobacillus spathodeae]MBM7657736.1 simple sugar transport system ATP-binding protein [Sporolactobacillus spathodeae]